MMTTRWLGWVSMWVVAACAELPEETPQTSTTEQHASGSTSGKTTTIAAVSVTYDNTASGLAASSVQKAIDEVGLRPALGGAHAIVDGWTPVTSSSPVVTAYIDKAGTYMIHAKIGVGSSAQDQAPQNVSCWIKHGGPAQLDFAATMTEPYTARQMSFLADVTVTAVDGTDNRVDLQCEDLYGMGHVQAFNAQVFAIRYR